jgi:hypothetical protein
VVSLLSLCHAIASDVVTARCLREACLAVPSSADDFMFRCHKTGKAFFSSSPPTFDRHALPSAGAEVCPVLALFSFNPLRRNPDAFSFESIIIFNALLFNNNIAEYDLKGAQLSLTIASMNG